jgi:glucose-6-phosphate isomerase
MTVEIGFPEPEETTTRLQQMADAALASRIAQRDASLWGEDAQETAATRLGWTDLHTRAAGLIEQVEALRAEFEADGVDRFVLAGMGGSSLGAGVIASAHGAPLTIVDTTDPHDIAALCESDGLERSALVVATKSGTTIETISAASAFAQALLARDIDPRSRLVAVTDPGTTLAEQAVEERWRRVFLADPSVGGRFSALSAFGLVPAGLAGADVRRAGGRHGESRPAAGRPARRRARARCPDARAGGDGSRARDAARVARAAHRRVDGQGRTGLPARHVRGHRRARLPRRACRDRPGLRGAGAG